MSSGSGSTGQFQVVIAGGGVAALEAALALRAIAKEQTTLTLLAPDREFVYRPMRVREPFDHSAARRYELEDIARDIGVELRLDSVESLDPHRRIVRTGGEEELSYDALLLATGASVRPAFEHGLTIDDRRLDEQLQGLVQDVEDGHVKRLAFVAPSPMPWPIPIYELALMSAARAFKTGNELSVTIATPEDAPLEIFGAAVSGRISDVLEAHGITMVTSVRCEIPRSNEILLHPGQGSLHADRIVALPELVGPRLPGLPGATTNGFIPVDAYGKVPGIDRVFAAGDATDFPVKHGGLAAQQADAAAYAIAVLAGAPVEPRRFHPVIHAMLLGAEKPLYLRADLTGSDWESSQISETPIWAPATKIAARFLGPYLDRRDRSGERVN